MQTTEFPLVMLQTNRIRNQRAEILHVHILSTPDSLESILS